MVNALNACGHVMVLQPRKSGRRLDSNRPDLLSFCLARETGRDELGYIGDTGGDGIHRNEVR
jgi:hypothetical protein